VLEVMGLSFTLAHSLAFFGAAAELSCYAMSRCTVAGNAEIVFYSFHHLYARLFGNSLSDFWQSVLSADEDW